MKRCGRRPWLRARNIPAISAPLVQRWQRTPKDSATCILIVNADSQQVIDIARSYGALGWKVNGAGGDGGSVSILCGPRMSEKRAMLRAIEETNPLYQNIPVYLSRMGLRVWQREPDGQA